MRIPLISDRGSVVTLVALPSDSKVMLPTGLADAGRSLRKETRWILLEEWAHAGLYRSNDERCRAFAGW